MFPMVSHVNPIQTLISYLPNISLYIILPPMSKSSKWYLPSLFFDQNFSIYLACVCVTSLVYLIILDLNRITNN
jgi:hypothetical protein